jgi:PAS domain S-box-containing protein
MIPAADRSNEDLERQCELTPDPLLAALEYLDLGIMIIDAELRIVVMNGRAKSILGIPADFVQTDTTMEDIFRFNAESGRYGPGDVDEHVQRRADAARRFQAHESERIQPDGTTIHIKRTPLPDGRLLSVYSDVTAARKSERDAGLAKAILDQLPSPVFCKDDQRRYEFCNATHLEIYGLTWEGAIGTTGAQTIAADEVEAYKRSDEHILNTGEKFRAEHQIKRADGTVVDVVTSKTRIQTSDGKVHIVGSIADVSDLKQQENRLRDTREDAERDRKRLIDAIGVLEEGFAATARGAALDGTHAANKAVSAMATSKNLRARSAISSA